ncbi:MAG TPA: hypothetical protein DHW02_00330 [Ktedonobacter sp.]|nr:hypothetical protein [Ktedonobacter sp.]
MANDKQNHGTTDLDARLRTYFGPPLPEQPLSSQTWNTLHQQLRPRYRTYLRGRRWHGFHGLRRNRASRIPSVVQDSLERVMHEARWHQHVPTLYCLVKGRVAEPSIRITSTLLPGKPALRVMLPIYAPTTMQNIEMDVLIASGLARFVLMKRLKERILRYVYACLLVIICLFTVYSLLHKQLYLEIPIAIVLSICILFMRGYQQRRQVFSADEILVYWLSRSRVCEGLHLLANRSHTPHRWQLSEPSLEERIQRVCGTQVTTRNRDLTLVG